MIGRAEYPKGTPFMERIQFEPMSGCWLWDGSRDSKGYGQYRDPETNRNLRAHRVCYEFNVGPIPDGMELDHKCRNRACVNPDHLEPVSHHVNTLRGIGPSAVNAVKTHCPKGHKYGTDRTRINPNGSRHCRECDRIAHDEKRRRKGITKRRIGAAECPYGHPKNLRANGRMVCGVCDAIRHYNKRHPDNPRSY